MTLLEKLKNLLSSHAAGVVVGSVLLTSLSMILGFVILYKELPQRVRTIEQKVDRIEQEQLGNLLRNLQRQVSALEIAQLTMTGVAQVGPFGENEDYAMVNLLSPAAAYFQRDYVSVANMDREDVPVDTFKIRGSFRDRNDRLLIRLSRQAARRLNINDGELNVLLSALERRVLLSPVDETQLD